MTQRLSVKKPFILTAIMFLIVATGCDQKETASGIGTVTMPGFRGLVTDEVTGKGVPDVYVKSSYTVSRGQSETACDGFSLTKTDENGYFTVPDHEIFSRYGQKPGGAEMHIYKKNYEVHKTLRSGQLKDESISVQYFIKPDTRPKHDRIQEMSINAANSLHCVPKVKIALTREAYQYGRQVYYDAIDIYGHSEHELLSDNIPSGNAAGYLSLELASALLSIDPELKKRTKEAHPFLGKEVQMQLIRDNP